MGQVADSPQPTAPAKAARPTTMTLSGTVNKTLFLIALTVTTAVVAWNLGLDSSRVMLATGSEATVYKPSGLMFPLMIGGALGGLVLALVTVFKPTASPVTAPMYALVEGLFVGGISAFYATSVAGTPTESGEGSMLNAGLVLNAALLTFAIAGSLCAAYAFKLVRPGKLFYTATIVGTMGVCAFGLIAFVGAMLAGGDSLFGQMISVYDPNNGGVVSVLFSLFVVGLASANLVLDYDIINNGVKNKAPRYMEWYGGFAVLVTLVWLYIELLRLLAKLRSGE